jgi:hypothetical protein
MTLPAATDPFRTGARRKLSILLAALVFFTLVPPSPVRSQSFVNNAPDAQRNAMNAVRTQVSFLQNATRTASHYPNNPVQMVWDQFQSLRAQYNNFTATLSPRQQADFANEWSELGAGLDIIQEAFGNYQQDVADGRSSAVALSDLCRVMSQAARVWLQQFNATASDARVGW